MSTSSPDGPDRRGGPALLPPELLEGLGGLDVIARVIARGFISGIHRSPFLGSGEDFSRHRVYQQGDDMRRLDWRLFGRSDRLYVRLFEEASNLQSFILVDSSASMAFDQGSPVSKLRYAQFLAAALSHLMLRSGDAVGLASYGSRPRLHLPPRNRPGHLHDLLLNLERLHPEGDGEAGPALDSVGGALRRGGRVILISDLLDPDMGEGLLAAVGRLRARGDEVMVLRPLTPVEVGTSPLGPGLYFDPEHPERAVPAVPADDPGYRPRVGAHFRRLGRLLVERGAEYVPLVTTDPVVSALGTWLRARRSAEGWANENEAAADPSTVEPAP